MNRQPDKDITALYERLSRDDEMQGDSNSIIHQKKMLEDYAGQNSFGNIVHYTDDGWSGTNFERPSWKKMIADIEAGRVTTVICKDMSRIGRDYLQVGFYTEVMFREKGVRFIAIANGVDSINKASGEFAPFLNIVNEWYARDSSRKVTAVLRARGMEGKHTTNHCIYGYRKDPQDKTKWLIDEEAAAVVRRIFRLCIEGHGPYAIARILAKDNVERPSYYLARQGMGNHKSKYNAEEPYAWRGATVGDILGKPEYMGHTVNFRTYKDSYKDKQAKKTPKEDWVIFEDTQEPIVDAETWETAQRCRKVIRRTDTFGEANPLTGLLFCADCGARMYNHREKEKLRRTKEGKTYKRSATDDYSCSTYNLGLQKYRRTCTTHYIRTDAVRELLLVTLRAVSGYVRENEAEFVERVRVASALTREEAAKAHRKRLAREQKRVAELNTVIKKLFEDTATGKLTDKRFEMLSSEYEREQEELEASIENLQAELDGFAESGERADKFIELVKKHTDFTELTTPMIHEFVEKIMVHESDRSSGEREQQVDIYLNFIGRFDVPMPEPTPEELAEEEARRQKREKRREYNRRYMEKKRRLELERQEQSAEKSA